MFCSYGICNNTSLTGSLKNNIKDNRRTTVRTPTGSDSLLLACLGALGCTRVVSDLTTETYSHGHIAIVHSNHRNFLLRRTMRETSTPNVRLKKTKTKKPSKYSCD